MVLQWLALTPRQRHPYHAKSEFRTLLPPLNPESISRVLAPFQTIHERNAALSAPNGRNSPIWLRTSYVAGLADNYEVPNELHNIVRAQDVLDNEKLYNNLADDWRKIFLRVPSMPDTDQSSPDAPDEYVYEDPDEEWGPAPEEEYKCAVHKAQKLEKTMLYLLDEEALRENLVKVMWIDAHGNCVWDFKVQDLESFQGPLKSGLSLYEIIDRCDYNFDEEAWKRGALLYLF